MEKQTTNFNRILFWSITVALGGFLFGFDTAVISGAERDIQRIWGLSDAMHGTAIALALYGTVIGALLGGIPADRWGRKRTLFWIGIFYLISALGSALSPEVYSFMFFRFLGGLGVGASSVAAPMYISEISPAKSRGKLVALFQFNIVLGIVIAYLSNYFIDGSGANDWRWMLGVETIPALIFSVLVTMVPRSPRWLIFHENNEAEARTVLEKIGLTKGGIDEAVAAIKESMKTGKTQEKVRFFSRKYGFPILLAFLVAFFNQVSGINAIIYYAPRIFEMTGMESSSALLSSFGIGVINLIFTMLGLALIDRLGRKTLLLIGCIGYIVSLSLVSRAFFAEDFEGYTVLILLFVFIASHAIGQGAVIWVFISEIFPNEVRANGQSLGSFTHWIMAAIISNIFPYFANTFGGGPVFAFFCIMMVVQLIFVLTIMPETKGVSLEDMQEKLYKSRR
jgi:SP family arabinose:H+ symporter-like MFS transporter